jgi:transcriptional regulator with GAF, ATPase, and Fis domain
MARGLVNKLLVCSNLLRMHEILWLGEPPGRALGAALRASGFVPRARRTAGCVARIACRKQLGAREAERGGLPLIWLGTGRVDAAAGQAAVLRGAYDAFSRRDRDAPERLVQRLVELCAPQPAPPEVPELVTVSSVGRRLIEALWRAARTSQPVLLTGETGTGKEVAARLIHRLSARRGHRFIPINCAAIPNELMESELFGYARGAFSGAVSRYDGQLMAAQGGSVFLDEIDDTPLTLQNKLLRVLEDHVVSRLGENEWHRVDFRLIAATNRDLRELARSGQFGADLFERLAIVAIELPPLRARLADLPALVEHFIGRFYDEEPEALKRGAVTHASPEALHALCRYPWPGNVRELRNVVYNALVSKRVGTTLLLSDLPRRVLQGPGEQAAALHTTTAAATTPTATPGQGAPGRGLVDHAALRARIAEGSFDLRDAVAEVERTALVCALERSEGSAAGAARLLGRVGRGRSREPGGTVRAMMRRYRLRPRSSSA